MTATKYTKEMKDLLIKDLQIKGYYTARLLCGSKSTYSNRYPKNVVFFNANLIDEKFGKIWYGDLDLTVDGRILINLAQNYGTTLYVLREMDGRFENDKLSTKELIKKAKWNTNEWIPIYNDDYEMVECKEVVKPKARKCYSKCKTNPMIKKIKIDFKNIELAPTDSVEEYGKQIDIILSYLKHPEALVTDESCIGDFFDVFAKKKDKEYDIDKMNKKFGFKWKLSTFLVDAAKDIAKRKK